MNRKQFLLALVGTGIVVQFAVLTQAIIMHEWTLRRGDVCLLETGPVDPVDAFRGRYVALAFRGVASFAAERETIPWRRGDAVWLALATNEMGVARIAGVSRARPRSGLALHTRVTNAYSQMEPTPGAVADDRGNIPHRLTGRTVLWFRELPCSRYYMPEDLASQAEQAAARSQRRGGARPTFVRVRISGGTVAIEDLLVSGVPVREYLREEAVWQRPMRGVVLDTKDLTTVDWLKLAKENGINSVGVHGTPEQVATFVQSERGKSFISDGERYGVRVEHQLDAISQLLPRELFSKDPDLFRMGPDGVRRREGNLCVHSEKALDIVASNALKFARLLPSGTHRYYYRMDEGDPVCVCPRCARFSASEQALIVENRILGEIRKADPLAMLAHVACGSMVVAPRRVNAADGIFLEFMPFCRVGDRPLSDRNATGSTGVLHGLVLRQLRENLTVFPAETAVVLHDWLDISLPGKMKELDGSLWRCDVFEDDLTTCEGLGVRHLSSFAVFPSAACFEEQFDTWSRILKEYGEGKAKGKWISPYVTPDQWHHVVRPVSDGVIHVDGNVDERVWRDIRALTEFTNPWDPGGEPKTALKLARDGRALYFLFVVDDPDIELADPYTGEQDVEKEDRVAVLFAKDKDMGEYYGFEIDSMGRSLAYKAAYYRNFDYGWEPPDDFKVAATRTENGFIVEGAVPRWFLSKLERSPGGPVWWGTYRCSVMRAGGALSCDWLSLHDPLTAQPDFHVPAAMRMLIMN